MKLHNCPVKKTLIAYEGECNWCGEREPVLDSWFPTIIYKEKLQQYSNNSYLESKAYSLRRSDPVVDTKWRCDTYNTLGMYDPKNDTDTVINDLIELCKEKVQLFANQFGVTRSILDLQCNDFWFNIAETGNYQECHQHNRSHFSLVYYVKTDEDCGNIVFKSPSAFSDMFSLHIDDKNLNKASYKSCFYKPENSLLLIFKSNLVHMVEKNKSSTDRISISMNFSYKD
jgi:uncharacterized protein (TIGR02466 family)